MHYLSYISALLTLLFSASLALAEPDCSKPIDILPISNFRAHKDFPVDLQVMVNRSCGSLSFSVISGPPELNIDQSGGLFYWTPSRVGNETITIAVTDTNDNGSASTAYETFQVVVDDNTMTYPLWRDYRTETSAISVLGRAHGADFVSYTLSYALQNLEPRWHVITGPIFQAVPITGALGTWDVSSLPDGGRYFLRLSVTLRDGTTSELVNQVILDRKLKDGWSKRIDAITHSPTLADLDGDGLQEVMAVTHSGALYVWDIAGNSIFHTPNMGATYSGTSVGDIDGDGLLEIIWTSNLKVFAHRKNGTLLPGFPIAVAANQEVRATPTLADLDNDGVLDILLAARGLHANQPANIYAYRYDISSASPVLLPGWPQTLDHFDLAASVSFGDLDGDGTPELVTSSFDRAYVFQPDGTSYAGWSGGVQMVANITGAETNGAAAFNNTSQAALADIDRDGKREVIIGTNVFRYDGSYFLGFDSPPSGVVNSISPAVADLDQDPSNGLEIILGRYAWHSYGAMLDDFPFSTSISSAVIADCGGYDHLDIMAGTRRSATPGVLGFHGGHALPLIAGYPKSLYGETGDIAAPIVGDFDADGRVDIAATVTDSSYGGIVAIYEMPFTFRPEKAEWPMLGHNILHTGYHGCVPSGPGVAQNACVCGRYDTDSDGDGIGNCNDIVRLPPRPEPRSSMRVRVLSKRKGIFKVETEALGDAPARCKSAALLSTNADLSSAISVPLANRGEKVVKFKRRVSRFKGRKPSYVYIMLQYNCTGIVVSSSELVRIDPSRIKSFAPAVSLKRWIRGFAQKLR